jgi:hypothetical protein
MKTAKIKPVEFNMTGTSFRINEKMIIEGNFHPIPLELWKAIIGFHRQVSINLDAESVSYHRWSEADKCYHTIIPYQKTSKHGLHVDVDWTTKENQELLNRYGKLYKEDFFPACTIHTHVDASAFESGTDAKDEEHNPGWHITLGKLVSKDEYHFDFRMRLPQTKKLKEFVDTSKKVNLEMRHLFVESQSNLDLITKTPGTTNWHKYLSRVKTK